MLRLIQSNVNKLLGMISNIEKEDIKNIYKI